MSKKVKIIIAIVIVVVAVVAGILTFKITKNSSLNNAENMTKEAQNCLLKTLEEPPEFVNIILIGSNESNFLSTIKSRCTILKFEDIKKSDIEKYLKEKFEMRKYTTSDNRSITWKHSKSRAIKG